MDANWTILHPLAADATNGTVLTILGDDSILAGGPNPGTSLYTVTAFASTGAITGFRLETLADPSLPEGGPGRREVNGNFVLTELSVDAVSAVSSVPEPASLIAIVLGFGFLSALRFRRSI